MGAKVDECIKKFDRYAAEDSMPQFQVLGLGNDHNFGTAPGREAPDMPRQFLEKRLALHQAAFRTRIRIGTYPAIGHISFPVAGWIQPVRQAGVVVTHHHDEFAVLLEFGMRTVGAAVAVTVIHGLPPVVAEFHAPEVGARRSGTGSP